MGSAKRIKDFEQITMKVIIKKSSVISNTAVPLLEMDAAAYLASLFQLWATYPFSMVITH